MQRETSARESHGGEGRIRAARFPACQSVEGFGFGFDFACGLKRRLADVAYRTMINDTVCSRTVARLTRSGAGFRTPDS
jgi:hypothetical protein